MLEGLWYVMFKTVIGAGGGVVVLLNGKLLGGDSGFTYVGTYSDSGTSIKGDVLVQNFDPTTGNVFGIQGDFTLNFEVSRQGDDELDGRASSPQQPGSLANVKLTRRTKLS
jgi:hypothetical protein